VPVPTVLGHVERNDDEVADADGNVLQATGAQVGLARLERMDERDLEVVVLVVAAQPSAAHSTSNATTTKAAITIA
jgi:hypothetical protein